MYLSLGLPSSRAAARQLLKGGFSRGKLSLQYNIKEESIVAKKLVRDHLQYNNITKLNKLNISCNTPHSRQKVSLREKTKEKKKLLENEMRERELSTLIKKQKNLISTCDFLEDAGLILENKSMLAVKPKRARKSIKKAVKIFLPLIFPNSRYLETLLPLPLNGICIWRF